MAVREFKVATSNRVIARDEIGRFTRLIEEAGENTVKAMIEEGAQRSRDLAPRGEKRQHDGDVAIRDSIFSQMTGRTSGYWGSISKHALPQETGSREHIIAGRPGLKFFWDREGRMFLPAGGGKVTVVHHPGNPPHPFLRPAYEWVMARWSEIAKRYYPS